MPKYDLVLSIYSLLHTSYGWASPPLCAAYARYDHPNRHLSTGYEPQPVGKLDAQYFEHVLVQSSKSSVPHIDTIPPHLGVLKSLLSGCGDFLMNVGPRSSVSRPPLWCWRGHQLSFISSSQKTQSRRVSRLLRSCEHVPSLLLCSTMLIVFFWESRSVGIGLSEIRNFGLPYPPFPVIWPIAAFSIVLTTAALL